MSKTKDSGANPPDQTPKKTPKKSPKANPEQQVIAILFPILGRVNKISALKEEQKCIAMIDDIERMFNEYDDDCFKHPKEKMFAILEKWRKQLSEKYDYKLESEIQKKSSCHSKNDWRECFTH